MMLIVVNAGEGIATCACPLDLILLSSLAYSELSDQHKIYWEWRKKMQQKHLNDINIFNWTRNLLINTTMRSDRNDITLSVKCNIAIMSSRLEGHRFRWIRWHRTHIISIELLNWLWWQVDDQSIHIHFWWRRWHSLSISSITRVDGELWSVY